MERPVTMLVEGLRRADDRLSRLDLTDAIAVALELAAQDLEQRVKAALSRRPGEDHSAPWLRIGSLRDSINHQADGSVAVIGSASDVALDQEVGTRTVPPRSFLASTAAAAADEIAASTAGIIGARLADR